MLKVSLCDYSNTCILTKGAVRITEAEADATARQGNGGELTRNIKSYVPFTDWISKINNMQVDNAKDMDAVMSMYNLIEYIDNYSKTLGSLLQYCKNKQNATITKFESLKNP